MPNSSNASSEQSDPIAAQISTVGGGKIKYKKGSGTLGDRSHPPGILVGIPAYNEEDTISELVIAAKDYADEVFVVDDGSSDQTAKRARDAGATLLTRTENEGYGATLGTIFQYAYEREAEHLVIMDGDGQHTTADIPDLVSTQQETGAEIVTGSRFVGDSAPDIPGYRRIGLAVINAFMNLSLRVGYSYPTVTDSQCGFRAYNDTAIENMATTPEIGAGMGASLDILFQAAREDYDIVEIPTRINYDVDNASTRNPVVHGFRVLKSLFISVVQDRPVRVGAVLTTVLFTLFGVGFVLRETAPTTVSVLATIVLAFILIFGLLLPSRTARRSDQTDQ